MRQLRADIDVEIALRQPFHVIREAFPRPRDAGAQYRFRNILDAFHQLNQALVVAWPTRGEADAAIAHDGGGDTVLRRGRDVLAPGDLTVVMGMNIDEARCYQFAAGVDLLRALGGDLADLGDAAIRDGDIRLEQFTAQSVGDVAAADHEVWLAGHRISPPGEFLLTASWNLSRCCQPPRVRLRNASVRQRAFADHVR